MWFGIYCCKVLCNKNVEKIMRNQNSTSNSLVQVITCWWKLYANQHVIVLFCNHDFVVMYRTNTCIK
ncbi:Sodium-dependent phosphate transport protein 1, chloroplastic [Dirofilaria immitis]